MTEAATERLEAAWPLASLFAVLSWYPPADGEAAGSLDDEAIARLVDRARTGDAGARRMLYVHVVDRVYRTVRGMLRSDADAEDVTQDAMLAVLTSLHTYRPRPDTRFVAWVTTIAANTARRRFRRRRPELTETGDLPDLADEGVDPDAAIDRARRRRALLLALAGLPEREREIVSLRYGGELNATEIAASVGMAPAAVRKALERARAKLAERLAVELGLELEPGPDGGRR